MLPYSIHSESTTGTTLPLSPLCFKLHPFVLKHLYSC